MDHFNTKMKLLIIFIGLTFPLRAFNYEREHYADLLIDYGSLNRTTTEDDIYTQWEIDDQFTKDSENKLLPSNHTPIQINTLRYFPKGHRNCYKMPFYDTYEKYLFRATFYYGNYDGLSKPPKFRQEIDGNFWENVTTSMSEEPVRHELLYTVKKAQATICLVRTIDDEVPFISSPEAKFFSDPDWYTFMNNKTALKLHSRINYGANRSVEKSIRSFDDRLTRIWRSKELPNYLNIHPNVIPIGYLHSENGPPWKVMAYAIQARNVTDPIYLSVDFSPQTSSQAYFVLYFKDPIFRQFENQTSRVEIYIDHKRMAVTDVPSYFGYNRGGDLDRVISLFPVTVGGSANVTISPAEGSTLAPILNAMEIFCAFHVSKAANGFVDFFSSTIYHFLSFVSCSCVVT